MQQTPKRSLSLFDSTCLIVGIIVGVGIFQVPPWVAGYTGVWWAFLAMWVLGGVLSFCGAIGYAELATAYPRQGGDYVYLSRAYGRWAGFLFGWTQLVVVRPAEIVGLAFVFATYAQNLWNPFTGLPNGQESLKIGYAVAAVIVLTVINIIGVREGKWTQNILTVVKALGLLTIVAVACAAPGGSLQSQATGPKTWHVALILVLFTFGGWSEMAYVAAEVKNPKRNIIRVMVLGTVAVTALYLLVNGAFLHMLGFSGLQGSETVASDAVSAAVPGIDGRWIAALVCISALGGANGLILAGSRISYAVGADHRVFGFLGRWNSRTGTPVRALILQGLIAVTLIVSLGSFIDAVIYVAAVVYSFYLATSLAVIVLRYREPEVERPYRVTGYPVPTLLFCGVCALLIYGAIDHKPKLALAAFSIVFAGVPAYWISNKLWPNDAHGS